MPSWAHPEELAANPDVQKAYLGG
ncbi:MAG: hypothetical protein LBR23_05640 [Spirochaetaceae bacterium]|nr:hypothetical protein [Spirochaetaceae bacterium]